MRTLPSLLILLTLACAASSISPERMRPVTGTWRTGQDMVVVIEPGDDEGYQATVKSAPGFQAGGMGIDGMVMRDIRAQADGSFTGTFLIPGAEPAKVRMVYDPPDRLVIVTRDSRLRGGSMVWSRERTPVSAQPPQR